MLCVRMIVLCVRLLCEYVKYGECGVYSHCLPIRQSTCVYEYVQRTYTITPKIIHVFLRPMANEVTGGT